MMLVPRLSCDPPSPPPVMPNRQKQILFSVSGVLGFSCALMAAVATGLPFWVTGAVLCRTGAELVNATGAELDKFLGELNYGLFHGQRVKQCGLGGRPSRFSWLSSCLVMVLFASEVNIHHLSHRIANFNEVNFVFQTYTQRYDLCFWLFFLVFLLHGLNFSLIRLAGVQFPFRGGKESAPSGGAADLMY
uniref:Clarin 1 n=2 Tax=Gasterosteus aculeatus TaxID=69293 RepID=A0AAQ4QXV6_GASAC